MTFALQTLSSSPISPTDFRISDEPTLRSDLDLLMGTEVVTFSLLDGMGHCPNVHSSETTRLKLPRAA